MSKTISMLACATMSAVLAGCASTTATDQRDDSRYVYNEKWSRAKNLAEPFLGRLNPPDTKAPEGTSISSDGSLLIDAAGWTANFYSAAGSGFLPGAGSWGSALGWGLGISLLSSAFMPEPSKSHAVMGYIPVSKVSSPLEARNLFAKQWTEATEATVRELYPNAKIEVAYAEYKKTWLMDAFYVGAVSIIDESIGCFGYKGEDAKRPREDHCEAGVAVFSSGGVTTMPPSYFFGQLELSHRFRCSNIFYQSGQQNAVDWTKILAASVKHLPELTIVYVEPTKTDDGKMTPPLILEKDRINFFVKPVAKNK